MARPASRWWEEPVPGTIWPTFRRDGRLRRKGQWHRGRAVPLFFRYVCFVATDPIRKLAGSPTFQRARSSTALGHGPGTPLLPGGADASPAVASTGEHLG